MNISKGIFLIKFRYDFLQSNFLEKYWDFVPKV